VSKRHPCRSKVRIFDMDVKVSIPESVIRVHYASTREGKVDERRSGVRQLFAAFNDMWIQYRGLIGKEIHILSKENAMKHTYRRFRWRTDGDRAVRYTSFVSLTGSTWLVPFWNDERSISKA